MLPQAQITHYIKALQEYIPQDIVTALIQDAKLPLNPQIYYSDDKTLLDRLYEDPVIDLNHFNKVYHDAIQEIVHTIKNTPTIDCGILTSIAHLAERNFYKKMMNMNSISYQPNEYRIFVANYILSFFYMKCRRQQDYNELFNNPDFAKKYSKTIFVYNLICANDNLIYGELSRLNQFFLPFNTRFMGEGSDLSSVQPLTALQFNNIKEFSDFKNSIDISKIAGKIIDACKTQYPDLNKINTPSVYTSNQYNHPYLNYIFKVWNEICKMVGDACVKIFKSEAVHAI